MISPWLACSVLAISTPDVEPLIRVQLARADRVRVQPPGGNGGRSFSVWASAVGLIIEEGDKRSSTRRSADTLVFPAKYGTRVLVEQAGLQRALDVGAEQFELWPADPFVDVVLVLPLEQYLAGVLPSEMPASWPFEALAAQAIAARSHTLAELGHRHQGEAFDFCAREHCQVYGAQPRHPNSDRAVRETRGLVLVAQGSDQIVRAVFSANCGGYTENNDVAWNLPPDPTLRSVPDVRAAQGGGAPPLHDGAALDAWIRSDAEAYCRHDEPQYRQRFRWHKALSAENLSRLLAHELLGLGALQGLRAITRGASGRIEELEIVGARGATRVKGELTIRRLLGGLNSSAFVVDEVRTQETLRELHFTGAGWGHGVGLCQMGARGRALAGQGRDEIVTHYYSGSRVVRSY